MRIQEKEEDHKINFTAFKKQVLEDYKIAVLSRQCSYLGRREVFSGKGKFGIFGDGKELPQLAMNHFFKKGDFRSGYYRDQTLLFAQGLLTVENVFAALYADLDIEREPMSGGRQMGGHFVTASRDGEGKWLKVIDQKNHSGDISPTGSQMPRLLGLAQASKVYRNLKTHNDDLFSKNGNEIAWGTIGNASTSEGMFFETLNAAGVMQVPMVISVWDDEYGISVSNKDQTVKESISEALKGFQRTDSAAGFEIITVKGWDYLALIDAYQFASKIARKDHVPVLVHVTELTQPLGHSSSGSHERYKSKERLIWEKKHDCNDIMRAWMIAEGIAKESELVQIENDAKKSVKASRKNAWNAYKAPILKEKEQLLAFSNMLKIQTHNETKLQVIFSNLDKAIDLGYKDIISAGRQIKMILVRYPDAQVNEFLNWLVKLTSFVSDRISSHLYTVSKKELLAFKTVPALYDDNSKLVDGRVIIRDNFELLLKKHDNLLIFGEDVG